MDYTLTARPNRSFSARDIRYRGEVGYRFGGNVHLLRSRSTNGLRNALVLGAWYGQLRYTILNFSTENEGLILNTAGERTEGVVRQTDAIARVNTEQLCFQLQSRAELSDDFALLIGLLFTDRRRGGVSIERTVTNTHFYDQLRGAWVPAPAPTSFTGSQNILAGSEFRFQFGLEYRGFFKGSFLKLQLESAASNRSYRFETLQLALLAGYRI